MILIGLVQMVGSWVATSLIIWSLYALVRVYWG